MDMLASHKMVKHKAKGKDLNNDKVSFFLAPKNTEKATGRQQESEREATGRRKAAERKATGKPQQCNRGATGYHIG